MAAAAAAAVAAAVVVTVALPVEQVVTVVLLVEPVVTVVLPARPVVMVTVQLTVTLLKETLVRLRHLPRRPKARETIVRLQLLLKVRETNALLAKVTHPTPLLLLSARPL
jgi:hypothetical protein